MNLFSIGNDVLVSENIASEYASSKGVVVAVETRQTGVIQLAEYEVEFKGGVRRRFLDFQLSIIPANEEAERRTQKENNLSIIAWRCDCGLHVKAMYETDGGMTTVRCPDPQGKCKVTHPIGGSLTHLWHESSDQVWTSVRPVPSSYEQPYSFTLE